MVIFVFVTSKPNFKYFLKIQIRANMFEIYNFVIISLNLTDLNIFDNFRFNIFLDGFGAKRTTSLNNKNNLL